MSQLRRVLSPRDLIFIVVGTVIGSGIFLTPGAVVQSAGSGGVALIVWLVGGVLSLLGALTFAELGAAKPESGGLYVYLRDAFGPLVAFLYGWTMFLVIGSGSLATLGAAFPRYVGIFVSLPPGAAQAVSVAMIALVTAVNIRGTRQSADTQGLATVIKVSVILLMAVVLIAVGSWGPKDLTAAQPWWPHSFSWSVVSGGLTAMIGVLWAYEGWQYVTFSAGEALDPQHTFARGIILGTASLIAIYELANIGYLRALGPAGVAMSNRVASEATSLILGGWAGKLLAAIILISIFSASNGLVLTLPRLFYAMARDGLFFARLATIHPRFGTPAAAIIGTTLWSTVLVLSGTFEQLLTYVVFMSWLWFALAALAIFAYRRRPQLTPRPFSTPGYPMTPVVFIAAALMIVGNTIVAQPVQSLIGLGLALLGVPVYFFWRAREAPAGRMAGDLL
ncbi:MAG TPA: amino acid permease [Vicinamibacterales bacterium]|nr:amino acid permease [Vicinamibacterales bacterium]